MVGWIIYTSKSLSSETYELKHYIKEAKKNQINLCLIGAHQLELVITKEGRNSILLDGEAKKLPDFVLSITGTGSAYYILAIIRHLEQQGVPCYNSSLSINSVKDKLYTFQILAGENILVPKTMFVRYPVNTFYIEKEIKYPIVIKAFSGLKDKGAFIANNKKELTDLLQVIELTDSDVNIVLQEYISYQAGKNVRVYIVGNKVIGSILREPIENNKSGSQLKERKISQFKLPTEIELLAIKVSKIMGLEISSVDLLMEEKQYKIYEVNSSPEFKELESCCDINVPDEVFDFIKKRLGRN